MSKAELSSTLMALPGAHSTTEIMNSLALHHQQRPSLMLILFAVFFVYVPVCAPKCAQRPEVDIGGVSQLLSSL